MTGETKTSVHSESSNVRNEQRSFAKKWFIELWIEDCIKLKFCSGLAQQTLLIAGGELFSYLSHLTSLRVVPEQVKLYWTNSEKVVYQIAQVVWWSGVSAFIWVRSQRDPAAPMHRTTLAGALVANTETARVHQQVKPLFLLTFSLTRMEKSYRRVVL